MDRGENIRREICLCLEEMGIQPQTSYHESGPGQNEIDFKEADALRSADNFITYKNVVSNIAARNGVYASFEAKPLKGKSGNGLHLYIALNRAGADLSEEHPQTSEAFLAGVFNRMRDITVFLNSQEESYHRFGENEAPKYITWSEHNSSRLLRVAKHNGRIAGFVLRSPDSGINPYLAFAFVLLAGLEGIKNEETLPPVRKRDEKCLKDQNDKNYVTLPLTLDEAIKCARESEFVQQTAGREIANLFLDKLSED